MTSPGVGQPLADALCGKTRNAVKSPTAAREVLEATVTQGHVIVTSKRRAAHTTRVTMRAIIVVTIPTL
jgi:hypothetical protein